MFRAGKEPDVNLGAAQRDRARPTGATIWAYLTSHLSKVTGQITRSCGTIGAGRAHGDDARERNHAEGTKRADTPGGRDRQRGAHREDRDRRDRGYEAQATSQARERPGGGEGASGEHCARAASGDRAGSSQREVGVMAHPATQVARYIMEIAHADSRPLTPLELMKLTYISHGWSLCLRDKALVSDRAEAWQYGPVYPDLYRSLKDFRASPVQSVKPGGAELFGAGELSAEEKGLINSVYTAYKSLNGVQLSALTHQPGTPWDKAWSRGRNAVIDDREIKAHFCEHQQRRKTS